MDGTYGTYVEEETCIRGLVGKPEGVKVHLEDIGVDGKIFKQIFK